MLDVSKNMNGEIRRAIFSSDRVYRYWLERRRDSAKPVAVYVGRSPSMADERRDDPTVGKLRVHAKANGYGGFILVNPFGLVCVKEVELSLSLNPVGCENDKCLVLAIAMAHKVYIGWGDGGTHLGRSSVVRGVLSGTGVTPWVIARNRSGEPRNFLRAL